MVRYVKVSFALLLLAPVAEAYVGPGLGAGLFTAIAAFLSVISLGVLTAFWYPLKRAIRRRSQEEREPDAQGEEAAGDDAHANTVKD